MGVDWEEHAAGPDRDHVHARPSRQRRRRPMGLQVGHRREVYWLGHGLRLQGLLLCVSPLRLLPRAMDRTRSRQVSA